MMLEYLAVLEISFQRLYINQEEVNWIWLFWIKPSLLKYITKMTPDELGGLLTNGD